MIVGFLFYLFYGYSLSLVIVYLRIMCFTVIKNEKSWSDCWFTFGNVHRTKCATVSEILFSYLCWKFFSYWYLFSFVFYGWIFINNNMKWHFHKSLRHFLKKKTELLIIVLLGQILRFGRRYFILVPFFINEGL